MTETNVPRWLEWAREIQSLSQTGLTFSGSDYETQRYQRLMEIAAEIVQDYTALAKEPLLRGFLAQPGYATPKVDVRGAVIRDGKILFDDLPPLSANRTNERHLAEVCAHLQNHRRPTAFD
jgi:hypothetical protein